MDQDATLLCATRWEGKTLTAACSGSNMAQWDRGGTVDAI